MKRTCHIPFFQTKYGFFIFCLIFILQIKQINATEFSEFTFLIARAEPQNLENSRFWRILGSGSQTGLQIDISRENNRIIVTQTGENFVDILQKIHEITENQKSRIFPVFLNYEGEIGFLDSVITRLPITSKIFFLPRGEAWPSIDYLIQARRNIILFVNGMSDQESRIMHHLDNYVLRISAADIPGNTVFGPATGSNLELFMVDSFDKLPIQSESTLRGLNMIPDYINFLLSNWTKYGKRPNFLKVDGDNLSRFSFIISQLNSFTWINGSVKISGKTMEKVFWKSPEVTVTGGKFSFPYRGGEEITLSPFVPGYLLTPQQVVVTGEMEIPESYTFMASPVKLSTGITGKFGFDNEISNALTKEKIFSGENYSFTQDIERGQVLKLPEKARINLGNPEDFGIRNSSFTVSCFVKFTEILEFGDNAVLGNHEIEYRRGLHLILRSGHPYFGLYSNDYVSEEKLLPNIWYHIVWRYVIETGEQAIFLNGKNIGSSNGHPPFSGKGDIYLGSALSSGASLRGYIDDLNIWKRPLGMEEINRLALNEEIVTSGNNKTEGKTQFPNFKFIILAGMVFITGLSGFLVYHRIRSRNRSPLIQLPPKDSGNQILLFGKFRVIGKEGNDITQLFTPKVKELLLFVMVQTLKSGSGATVSDINDNLWPGIPSSKLANNRAVTLNKLRKILQNLEGIEITVQNGYVSLKTSDPLFCDFIEAFKICSTKGELSRAQMETFFLLISNGRLLQDVDWHWLDEIRGMTGNQVIDNLLKLAHLYKNEGNPEKIDSISQRILDYDELNEEATYLQIWALLSANNTYMAKFNFQNLVSKYQESLGEPFPMNYEEFVQFYSRQF